MSAHTFGYQHFLLKPCTERSTVDTIRDAQRAHLSYRITSRATFRQRPTKHNIPRTSPPKSHPPTAQHSHLHNPLRPGRSYCPFETKLSTATFAHTRPREVIALCTTLLPSSSLALLAYDTHIRSILPRWATPPPGTTRHQTIFHLIRPFSRGTLTGTSLGIFLYRRCAFVLRRATLLP